MSPIQVLLVQLTGRFLHASFDKRMIIHASSFELDMHVPWVWQDSNLYSTMLAVRTLT